MGVRTWLGLKKSAAQRALEIDQARRLLSYTKASGKSYSGKTYAGGYHTIDIHGHVLPGQRDPAQRLALTGYDFRGKRVLDLGSNQGGMLHALDGRLKWGVGVDFDHRLVNAATKVARVRGDDSLSFYVFDFDREPLELLRDMMPEPEADIVFMLALNRWIKRWPEVILFAASVAPEMMLEANGKGKARVVEFLQTVYEDVSMISATSDDDPGKARRQTYWCRGPTSRRAAQATPNPFTRIPEDQQ